MRSAVLALLAFSMLTALAVAPASPRLSYEDRAVELLREYLRIDTTNPPGNEAESARFLRGVLEAEGIPVQVDEFAPGRANLLATLRGSGRKRPLILMNHMDVVPADASRWSVPPFSGEERNGSIYGRGAQDMKTEGILQLVTLVRAKREGLELDRDVLFLATADEEIGFAGALRALSPEGFRDRLAGAEFLITEGGENVLDGAARPAFFGVDTSEKGAFWLTLRAAGTPGHGSVPLVDSAPNRLIRALERIRLHRTEMRVLPSVQRFFADQAGRVGGMRAQWYRDLRKALRDPVVAQALSEDRAVAPLLRNTISITVIRSGYRTNVIPGTAEAELDVRLLPGEDPEDFLAELRRVIDDPTIEIVRDQEFRRPNESPVDTELFRTIEAVLARRYPGVGVTTKMLTGATESVLFRPLGTHSYGFTPLLATRDELETGHGDDERVRAAAVREAVDVFYDVVRELCRRQ